MKTIHDTQVVIVGAGAIGCSIAYYLADRGAAVTVVEAETVGAGTSTATLGLVWVQEKGPAEYMELNLAGARLHAQLAEKFDEDVGLRQPGGIILCLDDDDLDKSLSIMDRLNATSDKYRARVLSPAEVREMEPFVSSDIAGGVYGPHDGHINPNKLVFNLARLAERRGARFVLRTPVQSIMHSNAGVTGVETAQGGIRAKSVVVAAGTGAPALVRPLGFQMPIEFDRGQILVTASIKPLLNHPTGDIRQTAEGNILMGTIHESAGLDTSTTVNATQRIAANAIRVFPILKGVPVIRQFAGIRPMPIDGKPYLGPVERVPGLYIAVSHSGITLSPIHGKVISELILDGKTDIPIERYQPERYAGGPPKDSLDESGHANE